jgi:hypothetical protein
MCEEEDLDLVFNATPWRWHVPISVAAMQNDKHAASEVPAAITIDECWQLVENAETYQKHCVMMENVNYGRWESMVLNMVRQGLFGEILHGEGGYLFTGRAVTCTTLGQSSSAPRARASGVAHTRRPAMAIFIPHTDWVPSPNAWTSIAATGSNISFP